MSSTEERPEWTVRFTEANFIKLLKSKDKEKCLGLLVERTSLLKTNLKIQVGNRLLMCRTSSCHPQNDIYRLLRKRSALMDSVSSQKCSSISMMNKTHL